MPATRTAAVVLLLVATGCAPGAPEPGIRTPGQAAGPLAPPTPASGSRPPALHVLPFPDSAELTGASVALPDTLRCHAPDPELRPLVQVLDSEYPMLGGRAVEEAPAADGADCRLVLDPSLPAEAYRLELGTPSETLPALPTPGHRYTGAELRRLDRFARERGVALVPEIEMPGHAGQFTARMPEVFGVAGAPGSHTLNMGREQVYSALDGLLREVADVFRTSPYIHIGADEARLEHLAEDPDVQQYLARHSLPDVHELYRHFLVRVDSLVRRQGRRTIVWEGFGPDGTVQIPRNILVMAWETIYQLPQELLENGYTLVNVSWKPFYVARFRKWEPREIYHWNLWRWGNWVPHMPSFTPIQIDSTPRVIGASMAAWAQEQHVEVPSLRLRLPALAERAWNPTVEPRWPFARFNRALAHTDSLFGRLLSPIRVDARGLRFPELHPGEGHDDEETWFGDTLTLALAAGPDTVIRYTLDGSPPGPDDSRYDSPLTLRETTLLGARAFAPDGAAIGYPLRLEYQLRPLLAHVEGQLATPLDSLWEKADRRAPVVDAVRIRLRSLRPGTIRYTLDDRPPGPASPAYTEPITVDRTLTLRARLFVDDEPVGEPWVQGFRKAPVPAP